MSSIQKANLRLRPRVGVERGTVQNQVGFAMRSHRTVHPTYRARISQWLQNSWVPPEGIRRRQHRPLPNSSYRMIALCVRHKSRHLKRQRFATSFGILRAPSAEAKAWPGLWHRATPLCFALQWLAAWVRARHVELSSGDLKTPAGPTQPADCTGVGVLRIQWKTCVRMIHSLSETSSCCAMAWRIKPSTSTSLLFTPDFVC